MFAPLLRVSLQVTCVITFFATLATARAQTPPAPLTPLPLTATLVLTPEFCATKYTQGSFMTTGKETFQVGKEACADLETEIKTTFAGLTVVTAPPTSGSAQIIVTPKFTNGHATTTAFAFSDREMDVFLEWTAQDSTGKTLWLQTVQGTAKNHMGNMFTHSHNVKEITTSCVQDVARKSAISMTAAPELQKFAKNISAGK